MAYQIFVEKGIDRDVRNLPQSAKLQIDRAIQALSADPRPSGCKKLTARQGYRIRAGHYRILYAVDDRARAVIIYRIKHRREAYR